MLASAAAALLVFALVTGCGTPERRADPAVWTCEPAEEQAGLIAERLTNGATELRRPMAVRLDPPVGQYVWAVAAEVQGEVGVWGVGPWLGGARILGVDPAARRWSDWGTAIADDSAAGEQRAELASRPEVDGARACLRE